MHDNSDDNVCCEASCRWACVPLDNYWEFSTFAGGMFVNSLELNLT